MNFKEAEILLNDIKAVISCKINADENGNIQEIHVLSDNSRHSKQLARDIRSALLSKYDITVDYKVISVAQIDKNLAINEGFRLVYGGHTNENTLESSKISVRLSWDDGECTGECEGIKSDKNLLKIAATATLNAIAKATGFNCFILEDIQISKIGGYDVMLSAVTYVSKNDEDVLIGSSVITNNKIDAVIKSTLNAVNRKICLFFKE